MHAEMRIGDSMLMLAEATNDAKLFVDVIQAAECRLAVALANVEGGKSEPAAGHTNH